MKRVKQSDRAYLLVLGIAIAITFVLTSLQPDPIDWSHSFSKDDSIPFGNHILFVLLNDLFEEGRITEAHRPLYNTLGDSTIVDHNYVIINSTFEPDALDSDALFRFVGNGNCAFISAQTFSGRFADSLQIGTDMKFLESDSVGMRFITPQLSHEEDYIYKKGTVSFYFTSFDTVQAAVIGVNNHDGSNLIKVPFGEGYFILSTTPLAFTNYNMLAYNNADYIQKALSYLPDQNVIWDEYYKVGNQQSGTPLRFILNTVPLRWAYFVCIATLLLFVVFQAKRKQKVIPIITPYRNTTLEFVETVGRLYYHKGDHKNLALKKITYFLEFVRSHLHLKTNELSLSLFEQIAGKSGVAPEELRRLYEQVESINSREAITAKELASLTLVIEQFYSQVVSNPTAN